MGVMFFWVVMAVMVVVLSVLIKRSMLALETEAREALNSVRIANNLIGEAGGVFEVFLILLEIFFTPYYDYLFYIDGI